MLEKKTSLQGQTDCGKDRMATQQLLNRHEAFELDRITYEKMAEGVIDTGKNLIERNPAESHLIAKKQVTWKLGKKEGEYLESFVLQR